MSGAHPGVRAGILPAVVLALAAATAAQAQTPTAPCRVEGVSHEVRCGVLKRPLRAAGAVFDLHYVVVPAVARQPLPDPVFFLAGGPGQSAIDMAGPIVRLLTRLNHRRDLVFVDQRGTGRSASLACPQDERALPGRPLAERLDHARQVEELRRCRDALQGRLHGDLRAFTTVLASVDLDAVRQALGAAQINLVGGSYGTRVALDYMRQYPQHVRRAVLDGVAPPDMVLPAAGPVDAQAALDSWLDDCERDAACQRRHPQLRTRWQALLESLPREVTVSHPFTGQTETVVLTRDNLTSMTRAPLYLPAWAAALPHAMDQAARFGRFEPLLGMISAATSSPRGLAGGMHFSVVCAEDMPRMDAAALAAAEGPARLYREVCTDWPRADVPAAFYTLPAARSATLLLSGGRDPVTPPRHGERVARALGAQARHVVAPSLGHGVLTAPCGATLAHAFIAAARDEEALRVPPGCAATLPVPTWFQPPGASTP